jgi:hypothetical protein
MSENKLTVTSVRYFETRRGLGYEAKTSVPGVSIWNDGMVEAPMYHPHCLTLITEIFTRLSFPI